MAKVEELLKKYAEFRIKFDNWMNELENATVISQYLRLETQDDKEKEIVKEHARRYLAIDTTVEVDNFILESVPKFTWDEQKLKYLCARHNIPIEELNACIVNNPYWKIRRTKR